MEIKTPIFENLIWLICIWPFQINLPKYDFNQSLKKYEKQNNLISKYKKKSIKLINEEEIFLALKLITSKSKTFLFLIYLSTSTKWSEIRQRTHILKTYDEIRINMKSWSIQ